MARTKNPRREILPVLRAMSSNIRTMVRVWGSAAFERSEDGRGYVTSPPERQPENVATEWGRLAEYMEAIVRQATSVHEYALNRKRELEEGE